MRKLIEELLEWQEEVVKRKEIPFAILEAPTGYGKTCSGAMLFQKAEERGIAGGYIHVLPLRAIVDDLYWKLINRHLPNINPSWLEKHTIGYQMMDYIDGREEDKSPYFLREIVVTTFDSFIYNLARLPIAELGREARHHEIPRSSILSSIVVLDEAHLYGGDIGLEDMKMFDALLSSVRVLTRLGVPAFVESATLPNLVASKILEAVKAEKVRFFLSKEEVRNETSRGLWDQEYVEIHEQISWLTEIISSDEVFAKSLELYNSGKKVLVMFNSPKRAIKFYQKILDKGLERIVLLHGLLTSGDRNTAYSKLKALYGSKEGMLAVTTQVIEAGVDVSFDVLFTEAAPPTVLTQRAGRVARYGGSTEAKVYVFECGTGPYNDKIVRDTIEMLREVKGVEWRLPEDRDGMISYKSLIEEVYSKPTLLAEKKDKGGSIKLEMAMLHPLITSKHLDKLVEVYCGLIREPLLTGYVISPDETSDLDELDPSRILVLNRRLASTLASKEVLHKDGNQIIALKRKNQNGVFERYSVYPSIFRNCRNLFRLASEIVLLINESFYYEGLGLAV